MLTFPTNPRNWNINQLNQAAFEFTGGKMPQDAQQAFVNGPMTQSAGLRKIVHGIWRQQLAHDFALGKMSPAAAQDALTGTLSKSKNFRDSVARIKRDLARIECQQSKYIYSLMDPSEEQHFEGLLALYPELKANIEKQRYQVKEESRIDDLITSYVDGEMTAGQAADFEGLMVIDTALGERVKRRQQSLLVSDYINDRMSPAAREAFKIDMSNNPDLEREVTRRQNSHARHLATLAGMGITPPVK